jgi:hypothetical protein
VWRRVWGFVDVLAALGCVAAAVAALWTGKVWFAAACAALPWLALLAAHMREHSALQQVACSQSSHLTVQA